MMRWMRENGMLVLLVAAGVAWLGTWGLVIIWPFSP